MFISIVDKNTELSNVEKLHYLKMHVKGEAERCLAQFSTIGDHYTLAWQTLTDRFENRRYLILTYLDRLFALSPLTRKSATGLQVLRSTVKETLSTLSALKVEVSQWDPIVVHFIIRRLDKESLEQWEMSQGNSKELAPFSVLDEFLAGRIGALESLEASGILSASGTKASHKSTSAKAVRAFTARTCANPPCPCCGEQHFLTKCAKFAEYSIEARQRLVRDKQRCYNCLGLHLVNACKSTNRCRVCSGNHNTLLHIPPSAPRTPSVKTNVPSPPASSQASIPTSDPKQSSSSASVSCFHADLSNEDEPITILATAYIKLYSDFGAIKIRALLDPCAEASFIRESVVQWLNAPRTRSAASIYGVGKGLTARSRNKIAFQFGSYYDDDFRCSASAYILPNLTGLIPHTPLRTDEWHHIVSLELADPDYASPAEIDVILGGRMYWRFMHSDVRRGTPEQPVAQLSTFGWIVSGKTDQLGDYSRRRAALSSFQKTKDADLSEIVNRFWSQEDIRPTSIIQRTPMEEECDQHFITTHSRDSTGRYVVRLPFCKSPTALGKSYYHALKSCQRNAKKLQADAQLRRLYTEFMDEYRALGHMQAVPYDDSLKNIRVYLPHHGVLRESSTTTKLRVVFNGSAITSSGLSLNDCLHVGQKLQTDLSQVILRWRLHYVAFIADITKMYRQILIHPADQDFQRIFWQEGESTAEYRLTTVTYGLTSAPFLALRTIQQLRVDESHRYPLAADILLNNMYVDDVLAGADSVEEAQETISQLDKLLMAGGFVLQKWAATEPAALTEIPASRVACQPEHHLATDAVTRALGLLWNSVEDSFEFRVDSAVSANPATKRTMLSKIARLFDPLGWISPVFITAKIILQTTWEHSLDWNDPVPPEIASQWEEFERTLPEISTFRIPRWVSTQRSSQGVELHGFSDASSAALGAVVYLRVLDDCLTPSVSLLCSKSKVAPTKKQTIPRLELSAAVLLSRLVCSVLPCIADRSPTIHLWTDSTVTLAWLREHPSRWKEFVANRVQLIQDVLPDAKWHHVPGSDNPADCVSRGLSPHALQKHRLWWRGPEWLQKNSVSWPCSMPLVPDDVELEQRANRVTTLHTLVSPTIIWDVISRYSSLPRLLRVTAWVRRAADLFRRAKQGRSLILTPQELRDAESLWIRQTQASEFRTVLHSVAQGHELPRSSAILKLSPFVDDQGLLRVGGRLSNSSLHPDMSHPIILPRDSRLTHLILDDVHRRTLHGGAQIMLATLCRRFWIVGGRIPVRSFIHRCVRCTRFKGTPSSQIMGQMPSRCVSLSRPFLHAGIDYAGPFITLRYRGRGAKTYKTFLVVFVCLVTSAVHFELVTDYTSAAFIAAFKRFTG